MAVVILPVTVVDSSVFEDSFAEARRRIGSRDTDGIDISALAIHFRIPVWSNNDFTDVGVEWFTTARLLAKLTLAKLNQSAAINIDYTEENCRRWALMSTDIKQSLRILRHNPGFTFAALTALALGIGGNTAVFSIVNAVLLKPLPYPEPDRIVIFASSSPEGSWISAASPVEFNFLRKGTVAFQSISAYRYGQVIITGTDRPQQIHAAFVSADYFQLFGQTIARGRAFGTAEDRPGAGDFVVLSDGFWMRRFARDPRIIGRPIPLNGRPHEVIGIMAPRVGLESPASYESASAIDPIDVWMPFQIDPANNDQSGYFNVAARLRPGVSVRSAQSQMQLASQELRRRFPGAAGLPPSGIVTVELMRDALVGGERWSLLIFFGAVICVLLIACANVANLLLARASGRKREIAIRAAMGAGRGRIIRQLLTESVMLSLAGGTLGVGLGIGGIRALLALNTVSIPRVGAHGAAVALNFPVLCFTLLVSLLTGIIFGLIPAVQVSRTDLTEALKESSGRSGTGFHQNKVRSLLVVGEISLALVLLVGAGLLVRTFAALRSINPGFDARNVLTMQVSLTDQRFQKSVKVLELVRDSIQRITVLPGVITVASTCCLPLENVTGGDLIIAGRPLTGRSHGSVDVATVSPRYFDVLKIPILRGRAFTDRDLKGAGPGVIISEVMSRRYWPKGGAFGDPMGARLIFPDVPHVVWEVIGIAGDVRSNGLSVSPPALVYFSMAQVPDDLNAYLVLSPMAWLVRTRQPSQPLISAIQDEFRKAAVGLPVPSVRAMDEVLHRSTGDREFNMLLLTTFGGSALLLALIGIYGFFAYAVQQRRQEIGIRLALGAQPSDVRKMVMFQGIRLALIGIGVGLLGALALTRVIARFLFGVQSHDPAVFVAVPVFLAAVALAAVWFPARHAGRVNPIEALRYE
jgi:putative ABC transport system permease protein